MKDSSSLEIRVRHPTAWGARESTSSIGGVLFQAIDMTKHLSIGRPVRIAIPISLPTSPETIQDFVRSTEFANFGGGKGLTPLAAGQLLISDRWWLWQELGSDSLEAAAGALPPRLGDFAEKTFSGLRTWIFVTFENGEAVILMAGSMVVRSDTVAQREDRLRRLGEEVAAILRAISITKR